MPPPQERPVEGNRRGQLAGVAFLLVAVLFAVLLGTGAFSGSDPAKDASVVDGVRGTEETTALLRGVPQDGITLGRPDAPATVVEFVDLKCPVCRTFTLKDGPGVVQDLVRSGRAKVELRVLALESFRPDTLVGRTAVHALAAQDKTWNLAELLYYNQGPESEQWLTPALLKKIAGVSPELRDAPIVTQPTAATTRMGAEAEALADELGVEGTPTIYVRPSDRTDKGAYRRVDLRGTGSDAGKIASAVSDLGR
ncbi:thioredoxin domain-containing protein [Patulibacter sp.]|uniref:thioredoxin domain-containing protein n=1 Tax=Patulibacter sp. TaxID=1912859 RepID=UPI00271C3B96|nr:thioredoxin domain-containing protein [Patulibacter sp.]MDO9406912.1 thioredoxin domain-containing protein [Patulibacter sp.]